MSQGGSTAGSGSGSGDVSTLTGNSGIATPVAGNINVVTANTNVKFIGTAGNLTIDFAPNTNLLIGTDGSLTTGTSNTTLGFLSGDSITDGINSTYIGYAVAPLTLHSLNNTAVGAGSLGNYLGTTSQGDNVALGVNVLRNLVNGTSNIAIGNVSGDNYTGAESDNILIDNQGVLGESAKIRIGTSGLQNAAYVAGITGVTVANSTPVGVDSNGQLSTIIPLWYGDGTDGSQTFDGTTTILGLVPVANVYTLDRDIVLQSGIINAGVTILTNCFRIFCRGNLTNNGTIQNDGGPGLTDGSNGGTASQQVIGAGGFGGAGSVNDGNAGSTVNTAIGGSGGDGGAGGTGAAGLKGDSVAPLPFEGTYRTFLVLTQGAYTPSSDYLAAGAGGGGGGGDGVNTGAGGGGGGSGLFIAAYTILGTGVIRSNGGNGGNGGTGNVGGGGGGGGGFVIICSFSASSNAITGQTITATGGSGGTGSGTGVAGSNGSNGTVIVIAG